MLPTYSPYLFRKEKKDLASWFYPYQATEGLTFTTVNIDIFACLSFRGIMKMGNFACIQIRVLSITGSLGYQKSNFCGGGGAYFRGYFKKCELRGILYSAKISTLTVSLNH